jgi:hypothetical protein
MRREIVCDTVLSDEFGPKWLFLLKGPMEEIIVCDTVLLGGGNRTGY